MAEYEKSREQLAKEALQESIRRLLHDSASSRTLPDTWTPTPEAEPGSSQWMSSRRLERAAINQTESGPATLGRYENWAHDVYYTLVRAVGFLDADDANAARVEVIAAASTLRAFAEIQRLIDEHGQGRE